MNDETGGGSSKVQRRWQQIAQQFREQLAQRVSEVPAMDPLECDALGDALLSAQAIEFRAALHDKNIDDQLKKLYCDNE